MTQKTLNRISLEELKAYDPHFDYEHNVTEWEVNRVHEMINLIESTRDGSNPQVGDIIQYTTRHGDFYPRAHIDSFKENSLRLCEQPYAPFVDESKGKLYTTTSGGAWTNIPTANLVFVGTEQKRFTVWGRFGGCAAGAIDFPAEVNVWEYSEAETPFTTKTHDKYYVYIKEDAAPTEYKYSITQDTYNKRAFKTKQEYEAWLKTFHGQEYNGHWPNQKIVWALKSTDLCVPLEEYLQIEGAVIDSALCNAVIQECKRVYDGTTVTTYLPYQRDKIELDCNYEFMFVIGE